jgi:energy-converting hydrogenase B subunit D
MIAAFDFILLLFVIICAIAAISVKDLLSAVYILGAYSFFMCLLWTEMGAVDVAFTEASVSAGVGTVLLIAAVSKTKRRSKD